MESISLSPFRPLEAAERFASVGAAHSVEVTIRNSLAALHCTQLLGAFLTLLTSELEAVKALRRVVA